MTSPNQWTILGSNTFNNTDSNTYDISYDGIFDFSVTYNTTGQRNNYTGIDEIQVNTTQPVFNKLQLNVVSIFNQR